MKIQRIKWTIRKFNFDFPVGMFPVIIERLRGTAPRIEEIIKNIPEKNLEQSINNAWSVKQHIGHLSDLEELHESRIDDFKNGLRTLRPADMTNLKTNEANHNSAAIGKLISDFRNARNHFISRIENKTEYELLVSSIHPRLNQPMRLIDMTFFVAEHDDQHVTIMREIIS
ncbi:MAG: DinB family protein [Bacteroidia bacterium]